MNLPPINIIESSADYGNNSATLMFDGTIPGTQQIIDYVIENYSGMGELDRIEIIAGEEFRGLNNLGTIRVTFIK